MALICPTCKRRYEGDHVFCEDCGTSLLPGRPAWRKWVMLSLGAVLLGAGVWVGIGMIESDVRNNVKVRLQGYNYDRDSKELRVPVVIQNNSSVSFRVDSVSCRASIFGNTAQCTQVDFPPEIRRGEVATATLHVALDTSAHGSATSSIEVVEVSLHAWGIPIRYPVDPRDLLSLSSGEIDAFLNLGRPKEPPPQPETCCEPVRAPRKKQGSSDPVTGVFGQEKDGDSKSMKQARELAKKAASKVKDMSQMGGTQ